MGRTRSESRSAALHRAWARKSDDERAQITRNARLANVVAGVERRADEFTDEQRQRILAALAA